MAIIAIFEVVSKRLKRCRFQHHMCHLHQEVNKYKMGLIKAFMCRGRARKGCQQTFSTLYLKFSFRYYDHPLTAVSSAMLNISSGTIITTESDNHESTNTTSATNLNNNIQISNPHQLHQIHNVNGTSYVYEYYKVPEKDALQWR